MLFTRDTPWITREGWLARHYVTRRDVTRSCVLVRTLSRGHARKMFINVISRDRKSVPLRLVFKAHAGFNPPAVPEATASRVILFIRETFANSTHAYRFYVNLRVHRKYAR